MLRNSVVYVLALALACAIVLGIPAFAAEVDCDSTYCFSADDFSGEEPVAGICITQLPDARTGTVMLGQRVLRAGDILTSGQLAQMTFLPLRTERDVSASVSYLPIYSDRVAPSATMTIAVRGKQDLPPVAEDFTMETYKNLPNEGKLKVTDPEGQALTFTITRQPKRGSVEVREDGTFVYTPKKNKVGVDSFAYTAADPAGNVSREATVTIQIVKPSDAAQYTDTVGKSCRFAAEWMRNTGLFVGEQVGDAACFYPEKTVSRGEFVTMLVKSLHIPAENDTTLCADAPAWLKPYLAAAIRSGLTAGLPDNGDYDAPVTGAEAAVMLQNALDLNASAEVSEEVPAWAREAISAMSGGGIELNAEDTLSRGEVAQILYSADRLSATAPGTAIIQIASGANG